MELVNENKILEEEKISKLLLKFSVPCVMGLLISAFYNIVDQIFIGNSTLGYLGNAATGVSFPVICIANAFAWCVGDGAASYLSICAGRKDTDSAHKSVGTGITVTLLISIVLMLICEVAAVPLMSLFGASNQTLDLAVTYFRIIAAFFPFYLLLNVMNSMIRADGSPGFAMKAMVMGAIINIILDPIFIFLLKWGIAGAAWATAIGQVVSFAICAIYFFKPKSFRLKKSSFVPNLPILSKMINLGAATFITQISIVAVTLVCNMTLARYGALSKYGPDIPISVFSIQTKVYTIVLNIVTGIVLGGQPIFGYNYGAKRMDRVREAYKIVFRATLITGITATIIFQLWPKEVVGIFGSGNELYQEFAVKTFRIYLSLVTVTCLVKMTAVFFQSIGKSKYAVMASVIRDIVCFTPLAIILPSVLEGSEVGTGINGILYAAPISDLVAIVVILILTISFFHKLNKETEVEVEKQEELVV
ncbi:MATE family efflux transporter [uncultured Intestinibacter sp.]|uniref:MATE family efflux transporter n=1 Tax=uncultured Intestinibacter sp. TaxID=1505659 RepID=UPI0027DC8935|nr:MATE family efflux transporter [uncultured Intestinibacter sp.]